MSMDYISLCRWLCIIGPLCFFFALPRAYSRSITLEESLQHALSHNEDLLIAREDLEKSRQRVRHAVADILPQLDITMQYTRNWLLPTFFFDTPAGQQQFTVGAHNNLIGTVGIRQSVWGGGKSFSAMRATRLFRQFSMEKMRAAKQQLHTRVETAFYDLLLAGELARVSKSSVARARANFKRVEKLREAGRVSDYDLLRAQVQVAELLTDSIRTENARVLADLAFKNQIGIAPNEPIIPRGTFREKSHLLSTITETDLIDLSMQMHPIVRQYSLEVGMLQHAETIAQSESRPTIDLIVNGQWQAQKNEFDFVKDDFHQSWFSGIAINIPIFDGFRTNAQVAQARS
ncbi:MAG: TolC family protein, partial [Gemmatimonadetes bacterium]|nr:TolC family protein [Gemmatimonadota bacterium]